MASIANGMAAEIPFVISIVRIGDTITDKMLNVLNQLEHRWAIEVPRNDTGFNARDFNSGHSWIPSSCRIDANTHSRLP